MSVLRRVYLLMYAIAFISCLYNLLIGDIDDAMFWVKQLGYWIVIDAILYYVGSEGDKQ